MIAFVFVFREAVLLSSSETNASDVRIKPSAASDAFDFIQAVNATLHALVPNRYGDIYLQDTFLSKECLVLLFGQIGWKAQWDFTNMLVVEAVDSELAPALSRAQKHVVSSAGGKSQASTRVKFCGSEIASIDRLAVRLSYENFSSPEVEATRIKNAERTRDTADFEPAICSIIKGVDARHLASWIDYHASVGFRRIYLYVNEPWGEFIERGGTVELLAPRVASGAVRLVSFDRPYWYPTTDHKLSFPWALSQPTALNSCVLRFSGEASHFAFIDVDEFVALGVPLKELLAPPFQCGLLPAAWAVNVESVSLRDRESLTTAKLLTLGPTAQIAGDAYSDKRHKLIASAAVLANGGASPHGIVEMVDEAGVKSPVLCPSRFEAKLPSIEVDPSRASLLHVVSEEANYAVRPLGEGHPSSRNKHKIIREILSRPEARNATELADTLRLTRTARGGG